MRTEQILYFLEAVKVGSFTKAAANLHLQQPSLREAITNLENELGEALLIRTKKELPSRNLGKTLYPICKISMILIHFCLQRCTKGT